MANRDRCGDEPGIECPHQASLSSVEPLLELIRSSRARFRLLWSSANPASDGTASRAPTLPGLPSALRSRLPWLRVLTCTTGAARERSLILVGLASKLNSRQS